MKINLTEDQREVLSMIINDYLYTGYAFVDRNHDIFLDLERRGLIKIIFKYYAHPSELLKASLLKYGIDLYKITDVRILSCFPIHEEQLEIRRNYVDYSEDKIKNYSEDKEFKLQELYDEAEKNDCVELHFEQLYNKNRQNTLPITVDDIPKVLEIDENIT